MPQMSGMKSLAVDRWTWDPDKDKNRRRHGLRLEAGILTIDGDPLAASRLDPHPNGDRWQTVGNAGGVVILFIVHTEPGDAADGQGRRISVRKATARERKAYENETC